MLDRFRRYDVQATLGAATSTVSAVPFLVAGVLALRRYHVDLAQILYGSKSLFLPVFLGLVGSSMILAFVGAVLGWNSAGQRRNERQRRSWIAFFVGAIIFALNSILLLAFAMLRFEKPV